MKRLALLAAAALGAGCVSSTSTPPLGYGGDNVIVYWTFQHLDFNGVMQPMNCAQAGVDTVTVAFSDGFTQSVPCAQAGVDGVTVLSFAPAPYWVTVTGYRNGQATALYYSGQVNFTKVAGVDAVVNANVPGVAGNLTLGPRLVGWSAATATWVPYASPACANANVNSVSWSVKDGAGITLAQGSVSCTGVDPPAIAFTGASAIDLDTLAVRMQAWQTGGTAPVMDSCTLSVPHFGANDVVGPIDIRFPIPVPCN